MEWLQKNEIVAILQVRPKVIGFHMPLGEAKIFKNPPLVVSRILFFKMLIYPFILEPYL